jgi:hypothetical protein
MARKSSWSSTSATSGRATARQLLVTICQALCQDCGLYRRLVPSLDQHRSRIRAVLEAEADAIRSGRPSIESHLEDHPSRIYALSLILVFIDKAAVEDELLVIDVALALDPGPRWTIDATRGDGTFIAEDTNISESDQLRMFADADAAAARVAGFIDRARLALIDAISGPSTG